MKRGVRKLQQTLSNDALAASKITGPQGRSEFLFELE